MGEARKAPSVQIAKPGAEARDWSWVEASVWTDRMLLALENGVKGGVWYSVMDKVYAPATLAAAWAKVRANGGAAGVDRQSIERFATHADEYLAELSRALRAGDYRPAAIRRVEIPKGDGGMRPLGISHGQGPHRPKRGQIRAGANSGRAVPPGELRFRPGRGAKDALRVVDRLVKSGHCFVVDADLKSYFDTIPHDRLIERLRARVSDGRILDLVQAWLNQEIVAECGRWTPAGGTPKARSSARCWQISICTRSTNGWPRMTWRWFGTRRLCRLCDSMEKAQEALALIRAFANANGLTLHPDKTHIGDCRIKGRASNSLAIASRRDTGSCARKAFCAFGTGSGPRPSGGADKASPARSRRSIPRSRAGLATSSTRPPASRTSTPSCADGCERCCASKRNDTGAARAAMTKFAGPTFSWPPQGCSPSTLLGGRRDSPDEDNHRLESRMRENRPSGCVSSEGWHVQQGKGLPGEELEAP